LTTNGKVPEETIEREGEKRKKEGRGGLIPLLWEAGRGKKKRG